MSEKIERNYIVKLNINTGEIIDKPKMIYYNTDINTSYIEVELYSDTETKIEAIDKYKVEMNIVKPSNTTDTLEGKIELERILFKLPLELVNEYGAHKIEFFITDLEAGEENRLTTESIKYTVKNSILADINDDVVKDEKYPILMELIENVKELQDKYNNSNGNGNIGNKEVIEELKGNEKEPVIINSLESNFYVIPKDVYYKFYEADEVKKCENRTLLVLLKKVDQAEVIIIDSENIRQCIILSNELKSSVYMHSSKMLEYLKEMSQLNLDTLNTDSKKLVGSINELLSKYNMLNKGMVTEERIKTLISENSINEEAVKNIILDMVKKGEISTGGGYSFSTGVNVVLSEV